MNKVAIVVMVVGALITFGGIALIFTGDSFEENIEEGIIYEGADGKITIEQVNPNNASKYVVHLVDVKYVGGTGGGYNEAHGNSTWNLTEADCDKVKSFSLKMEDTEMFYPQCNYIKDEIDDKYIVIGRLCNAVYTDEYGNENHKGEGCRAGTYTWETNGNAVMVYDVEALVGVVLAFTMQDDDPSKYYQQNNEAGSTTSGAKGWDEQTDYIHRDKKEEEVPEKSEMATSESEEKKEEKKRSGEYELPPPPEI